MDLDNSSASPVSLSESSMDSMADAITTIIQNIGEDPSREGLVKTPKRYARALADLTAGYQMNIHEIINGALFHAPSNDMVVVRKIPFFSLCEHHLLPFFGDVTIAYIPKVGGKILGLSKFARIVAMYSQRLQVQERLTNEIANCLHEILDPEGVAVFATANHMCMQMRGVRTSADTSTSSLLGSLRENSDLRKEFFNLIK